MADYVQKINGNYLAASHVVPQIPMLKDAMQAHSVMLRIQKDIIPRHPVITAMPRDKIRML